MPSTRSRLLTRITAPASEPLTLAETKLYLRVDNNLEDSLIGDLIVAARMCAESYLGRSLISQSWKLAFNEYISNEVPLPMGPVSAIASVTIYNRDGSSQVVSANAYYLNAAKNALLMDSPLFAMNIGNGARIEIIYNTGYGDGSAVPKPIKLGLLAHIATMYDDRGVSMHNTSGELVAFGVPQQSMHLYSQFREIKL